jgi:hypothetical protein
MVINTIRIYIYIYIHHLKELHEFKALFHCQAQIRSCIISKIKHFKILVISCMFINLIDGEASLIKLTCIDKHN